MSAIDVEQDAGFGFRTEQGVAPVSPDTPIDGGEAVFGAAFRQTNTVVSALQYMRNSGNFAPVADYNPLNDIKTWKEPNYFLEHGTSFIGSQSPAETQSIKAQIDAEDADRRILASNGKIGFVASTMAGMTDPTIMLPGGVALNAAKGGLVFTRAAIKVGTAGFMQTVAQEALLHATQETRTYEESALNIASGTVLSALIGGGAASLLSRGERATMERLLHTDRAEINAHAENPANPEAQPMAPETVASAAVKVNDKIYTGANHLEAMEKAAAELGTDVENVHTKINDEKQTQLDAWVTSTGRLIDSKEAASIVNSPHEKLDSSDPEFLQQGSSTGMAASAGARAADRRDLTLVGTGPVGKVMKFTSPMQRLFGSQSQSARRAIADLAETSLLTEDNLTGGVTTAGPALDREARLHINQTQVATGDELTRLFSEYRYGEQRVLPRQRSALEDMFRRPGDNGGPPIDPKMSFDEFKEQISDAMRNGDTHENPQVQAAAQFVRKTVFEPWKKRAIDAGLLPEGVDVKTADSYLQRLYNKQAIAAKRPEFVERVTDWLAGDQAAKAQSQTRIGAYNGALEVARDQIGKLQSSIAKLEADADVIAARQEETTRFNKAANRRSETLRTRDQDNLPLENARGGAVFETLARNRGNLLADRASAKLAEIESLETKLAREIQNHDPMRAKIETEIAAWEGKSASEAKAALKARAEAEKARDEAKQAGNYKGKDERLSSADKAIDKAVKRILKSDRNLERQELRSRADEITDRIIGSPDGRLPYDLGMEHGTGHGGSGEPPRGALAAREFNIPDATIKDFLENDIEHLIATHMRTIVPDVMLTEKFGDVQMTEAFRKINDEYAARTSAAKSEKERTALEKERQGVISDLASVRDRIRGTYGLSATAPMRNAARVAATVKNYNVLTSMGSAALSSLPDMAGVVMRHGITNTFNDAWAPFFKYLTGQSDAYKEAGRQFRTMGIAVESVLASRHHALTDTLDNYHPASRVERTMQWATNRFQFVNMLAPWTDFAKINASMVAGSEILRATEAAAKGTATARQQRTLGESGIEPHMATRIHEAFQTGGEVRDGVHLPNTGDWTDAQARRVFEGAVARDADIAVVTPGQEKPLWMSDPILSVLGQFKSFTAAATERVLIANLQRRDAQVLQGLIFSMGLGMLSYKVNSLTGGTPTSDKPQDWIKESISRGNLTGWFEEANALTSKATRGSVDMYRLIGANKPLTRFASRSAMDQLLGPTAGKVQGILGVVGAATHPSEWNQSDSKAVRRLIAGQNVFYLRRLFDQVEASGNNAFGIPMKAVPENR